MSGLKHTFCCFLRRKITFKQEFRQQRSDFRNLNLAPKISLKPAFSMDRFLICVGEATDFENVPRNWHEKFGRSSFAALTSRVFFCSPSGSHFATQKQENSRRRATPGSAIAPLLRNGYAALRIPYMLCLLSRKKSRKDHSAIYQLLYSWIMNMFIP